MMKTIKVLGVLLLVAFVLLWVAVGVSLLICGAKERAGTLKNGDSCGIFTVRM